MIADWMPGNFSQWSRPLTNALSKILKKIRGKKIPPASKG